MGKTPAILFLAVFFALSCNPPQDEHHASVLLITIDTLRADRLGCTGHGLAHTPVLDQLAEEGVLFDCCIVTCPITLPSHASIMTGLLPHEMEVRDNQPFSLSRDAKTLAELFKEKGYSTRAVVAGEPLAPGCGLEQGFDAYRFMPGPKKARALLLESTADVTTAQALEAAADLDPSKPFFFWIHYFDPHIPYDPPPAIRKKIPDAYDGEVAFVDQEIGRLLRRFDTMGLLDRTMVAVTSDHGEGLGEHGEPTHAFFLYDTTIRVPLIVKGPGVLGGRRCSSQIRSLDLFNALMELAGIDRSEDAGVAGMAGSRELAAYLTANYSLSPHPAFSESLYCDRSFGWAQMTSLRTEGYKLVRGARDEILELPGDRSGAEDMAYTQEVGAELYEQMDRLKTMAKRRFDRGKVIQLDLPGYFGGTRREGFSFLSEETNRARPHPPSMAPFINTLLEAVSLSESGSLNRARSLLEKLVKDHPDNLTVLFWLGRITRQIGEIEGNPALLEEAFDHFQKAQRLNPEDPDAFHMAVWCLIQLGRFEDAEKALDQWIGKDSARASHAKTWELYGYLYTHRISNRKVNPIFDFQKGLEFFNQSLEMNPNNEQLLLRLVEICTTQKKAEDARRYQERHKLLRENGWQ